MDMPADIESRLVFFLAGEGLVHFLGNDFDNRFQGKMGFSAKASGGIYWCPWECGAYGVLTYRLAASLHSRFQDSFQELLNYVHH